MHTLKIATSNEKVKLQHILALDKHIIPEMIAFYEEAKQSSDVAERLSKWAVSIGLFKVICSGFYTETYMPPHSNTRQKHSPTHIWCMLRM